MKTPAARLRSLSLALSSIAGIIALSPHTSAQSVPARQNVDRLTLLTGPHLLSPPHGAPVAIGSAAPAAEAAPVFHFVPARGPLGTTNAPARPGTNGTLVLGKSAPGAAESLLQKSPGKPSADSLRFDATLHPAALPLDLRSLPPRHGTSR